MTGRGALLYLFVALPMSLLLQLVALPDTVAAIRPQWVALAIAYWAYASADRPVLPIAWITGLALDVLFNSLLGEHALALVTVAFLVRRLRGTLILFSKLQVSLAMIPIWALYAFLMFWIDGLSHHTAVPTLRWLPVIGSSLVWPFVAGVMDRLLVQPNRRRLA